MASIRIVSADYYMSYPNCDLDVVYSEFRGTEIRQVPVIQIFGSTPEGKKTCLNIHGIFPYVYIPYDGTENAGTLSYKIASELDKTINISLGQASSNTCHVHNIILASGLPIYGYHEKHHQFFKIYFYNPAIVKKACSLLENGSILGKCFQPHESHISYILQFMVDYNLHGMSFINVSQVKYRPNPKYPDQLKTIPKDKILPSSLQRRSVCELEMDCFACDIINVEEVLSGKLGTNPGIAALWEDEKQRRRDKQQDSQVSFCLSQERATNPEPTITHEFYAQRLADKLATNSNDTNAELDNSVYPAETPDDLDYIITPANITTAAANTSMFEDTLIPDSQIIPVLSQTDKNLLEILKELKENVHIDDDSVLSQQNAQPEVECSSGGEDDDEEEVMLSLPLNKTVDVPDDDAIWNDSFWDENCAFPQLDGTQDINNGFGRFMDDLLESGVSEAEITSESSASTKQECRYANEVFIVRKSSQISVEQQLNPGSNTLLTTEPKNVVSEKSRVKILSDLVVKPDSNVKVSWHLLTKESQSQLQLNVEKKDEEFVDPLPFADYENDLDDVFDINEIVLNDVNLGNMTPTLTPTDTLMDQLTPKTPHAHANQCSCRQSPCNSGNRLFGEDAMNLFNDRLYENNLPSSGDKENVATNVQVCQKSMLNAVKRNLKAVLVNKKNVDKQSLKYNLRSLESAPKDGRCCKLCADVGCTQQQNVKKQSPKENVVVPKENNTKVRKKPQLKLRELLSKLETKRKTCNNLINTGNRAKILVQIPLSKIFRRRRGRPKKSLKPIDAVSTTSSEDIEAIRLNAQIAELKINEKNNNKIIAAAENELINIPVKKRESPRKKLQSSESETTESISASSCTTESEELFSSADITIKKLNKLKLMNWNLDGQNDTPSSDSEHSQKNGIPEESINSVNTTTASVSATKPIRTRSSTHRQAPKFRVSGLTRKNSKTKNVETAQTHKSLQKKKQSDTNLNSINNDVNHKIQEHLLLKDDKSMVDDGMKVMQNGSLTSPRLLRNRKINANTDVITVNSTTNDLNVDNKDANIINISPKILRKRKSDIETNTNTNNSVHSDHLICSPEITNETNKDNFETINDEFKENNIENNPLKQNDSNIITNKKEKKSKLVDESNRPVLRNRSRYSKAERNLKRQKRLSLSLRHLREKREQINESESENDVKKELRVNLTQMPIDKLTKNVPAASKLKDLRIVLEPLSPEILEKYTSKISAIEPSPQQKAEETSEVVENGNQRITRNSIKDATASSVSSQPELMRRETRSSQKPTEIKTDAIIAENISSPDTEKKRITRQSSTNHQESNSNSSNQIVENCGKPITTSEIEKKRVTRQSSNSNVSSSDSCEEITEPIDESLIKKLNTTPTKKAKISTPSPKKYSPLNVIKSPRIKPVNVENETLIETTINTATTIEPLKKRLRNFDSNLSSEQENLSKKVRICAKDDDCSRGIGELQDNPIIQEEKISNAETKIAETETQTQTQTLTTIRYNNNDDLFQNCDTIVNSPKSANRSIEHSSPLKTPESVRANLFNINNANSRPALIEYKHFWKHKEDSFLNEIESICKNTATYNNLYYDENNTATTSNDFKTPPKVIVTPEKNRKIPEKLVLKSSPAEKLHTSSPEKIYLHSPQVTPKKSIITSADYLDYSPFASPEKGTVSLPFFFNSRETLSQQCEKELEDESMQHYTKTKNLTIAEKYDLERNFAPQPGTSKEAVVDDVIDNSPADSLHFEFSQNLTQIPGGSKIWKPKYHPPSADDIRNTLAEYNIPEHRYETPFYGVASDVTRKVDVGNNVLKIPSKTIAELEEYTSSLGFKGIETWRREKFKELYPNADIPKTNLYASLVGHDECVIRPVLPPPSRREVIEWLKIKVDEKEVKKPEKIRIVIPSSPGNNYNEDSDVSLTLSPDVITPTPPKERRTSPSSPVSSQQSPSLRTKRSTRRGNLQRKALFSSIKSSQSSPNFNVKDVNLNEPSNMNNSCQITGVTLNNTHGFKLSYENLQNAKALNENQHLTILVVELHIRTRGDLNPDPQHDAIRALVYSIYNDVPSGHNLPKQETGIIAVNTLPQSPSKKAPPPILNGLGLNCEINYVDSELELINALVQLIRKWDPDIFTGFEIELLSWGYLIERCYTMGINLPVQISRTNPEISKKKHENFEPTKEELKLTGRIVLDAWRLFRHEIALTSYTFENLMYHILHQRVPHHSFKSLSFWWDHRTNHYRKITADYYVIRAEGVLKLMDQLDLIGRTSELARLFGIQFYEVLSRGSQFRVESMMLRLAKPLNYISVSPSVQQRAKMRAPEWIPLIFEPQSRFYVDPIIVLDFQSLYPSIIIAYNYCFSTCVGRVEKLGTNQPFEFGATQLKVPRATLQRLEDHLTFSPCGVGFVKANVRKGILPRMLQEILETRLMVKASMKRHKDDKLLQRVLHSRQLGLKLIANVTYGYTAANFSGRMPCSEVGDSVVSKGRETLERAIKLIENTGKWRAKVVYGDTDSLFVQVAGRSRVDAFKIGEEIADAVTRDNPAPVKLKLEKVYQPCILQTKKRYVGYMYETVDQKEPEYSAKGIETVRRDGCPAVAKILEKSLRILFESRDVSLVKRYVCHQFDKISTGRASVQDLIFAREYRGASGYRPGACVPALELARRWAAVDKRREPRRGERVPYIVVHGPPGVPLIRLVRCPKDLLNLEANQPIAYRPNAVYYITKVIIPPLNRCFTLIGADVNTWYNEMPRKQIQILPTEIHYEKSKKSTISEYFATMNCAICNNQTRDGLCDECVRKPQRTIVALQEKIHKWERSCYEINQICQSCCGRNEQTECTSLDCPILYRLIQSKRDFKQVPFLRNLFSKF